MALAAVAVAAAPAASAQPLATEAKPLVIRLNWVDRTTLDFGYQPMTFKVTSVTISPAAWSVRASVTNRWSRPIRIARPIDTHPPQYAFGLGWAPKCEPPSISCPLDVRRRTYTKPTLLNTLRPGQTWTGVFGGPGRPPRGRLINVTFGYFVPAGKSDGFSWISQRAFKL